MPPHFHSKRHTQSSSIMQLNGLRDFFKTSKTRKNTSTIGSGDSPHLQRSGMASLAFAFLHPVHAKSATLNADTLVLEKAFRSIVIPFREIETAEATIGWFWGGFRVRFAVGNVKISGLSKPDAQAFADALTRARVGWWREALTAHIATIRSVFDRVAQLSDPPRYMARRIFSAIEHDAKGAVAQFPSRWPDILTGVPEIRMLKAIQDFLNDPERHRSKACESFIVNELERSRDFFDAVETRPLTDDQRRSVVVDEDRNLVVAAAGSGKTSVIVAKAGWLIERGYRLPSEMLLLAFARDAQEEE